MYTTCLPANGIPPAVTLAVCVLTVTLHLIKLFHNAQTSLAAGRFASDSATSASRRLARWPCGPRRRGLGRDRRRHQKFAPVAVDWRHHDSEVAAAAATSPPPHSVAVDHTNIFRARRHRRRRLIAVEPRRRLQHIHKTCHHPLTSLSDVHPPVVRPRRRRRKTSVTPPSPLSHLDVAETPPRH